MDPGHGLLPAADAPHAEADGSQQLGQDTAVTAQHDAEPADGNGHARGAVHFFGAGLPELAQARDEDILWRAGLGAGVLPLPVAAVAVEAHGRCLDDQPGFVGVAGQPLADLLGGALPAGQQGTLAGGVPAAFAHGGAGQVDQQVGAGGGVQMGQGGEGFDAGAEPVTRLVGEAGDDDDAPAAPVKIMRQVAADETAASQQDDGGLVLHEPFPFI